MWKYSIVFCRVSIFFPCKGVSLWERLDYGCACVDRSGPWRGVKLCPHPCLSCLFFLERREAAGADPGGAHQPGGWPEELTGQLYLQAGEWVRPAHVVRHLTEMGHSWFLLKLFQALLKGPQSIIKNHKPVVSRLKFAFHISPGGATKCLPPKNNWKPFVPHYAVMVMPTPWELGT